MTLPHAACLLHCIADHRNCKAKIRNVFSTPAPSIQGMHNSLCICSFSSSTLVLSSVGFPFSSPSRWVAAADFLEFGDWKWNELEDKTRQQYDLLFAMSTGGAKFVHPRSPRRRWYRPVARACQEVRAKKFGEGNEETPQGDEYGVNAWSLKNLGCPSPRLGDDGGFGRVRPAADEGNSICRLSTR